MNYDIEYREEKARIEAEIGMFAKKCEKARILASDAVERTIGYTKAIKKLEQELHTLIEAEDTEGKIWKGTNGSIHVLSEMDTSHIIACLSVLVRSLRRGDYSRLIFVKTFAEELEFRSERYDSDGYPLLPAKPSRYRHGTSLRETK